MRAAAGRTGLAGGTSRATPHVTGAAAFYAALNPCAAGAQIRGTLPGKATADGKRAGQVQNGRRLNVAGFAAELACR